MHTTYDMVFEGGGAKGLAFVGALEEFFGAGLTARRMIGTSAGAITATFLAAGYAPGEMRDAMGERDPDDASRPRFSTFMDPPSGDEFTEEERENSATMDAFRAVSIPGLPNWDALDRRILRGLLTSRIYCQLFSFVECGGFFAGRVFTEWVHEKLEAKGVARGITLADFARQTNSDLSLVVSDTTDAEMLVLNARTAPDCPVAYAVRMSMSIPFIWREVIWRREWGLYRGGDKTGNIIVDGGVLSNFPIRLIAAESSDDPYVRGIMGDTPAADAGNLGFLIDENLEVPGVDPNPPERKFRLRTAQRVSRLVDTMTGAADNTLIKNHEHEICRLPAKGYGTTEFDMSDAKLAALLDAGRRAMAEHLRSLQT